MSDKKIGIENLGNEIAKAAKDYSEDVKKGIEKEIDKTAKLMLEEVINLSSGRGERYCKGFDKKKVKRKGTIVVAVHNKKYPHLVHLLEKGHIIKNQKGTYGRTRSFPHMVPAYEKYIGKMEKNIDKIIKNGE